MDDRNLRCRVCGEFNSAHFDMNSCSTVRNMHLEENLLDATEWVETVIPHRTHESTKKKFMEEVLELTISDFKDPKEFADVLILLDDLARTSGVDLADAVAEKNKINNNRTWTKDSRGVYQHD